MSKKRYKVKHQKIYLDWLNYTIMIFFASDTHHFRNVYMYKRFKLPPCELKNWYALHTYDYMKTSYIIYPLKVDKGTVIHELSHVVDTIIEEHGFEGQEIRAYLLAFLTNKVIG